MLENEYRYNKNFRDYVDKYCKTYNVTIEQALKSELVRQAYLYYKEV